MQIPEGQHKRTTPTVQIALPSALSFVMLPFLVLHLIAGWNYYVSNDMMLISATLFMASLWVVWQIQLGIERRGPLEIDLSELDRLNGSWLPTLLGFVSLAWHGVLFVYLHFVLGFSAEELRVLKSEAISGFVEIPLNAIALTGFALLVLRRVTCGRGIRDVNLDTLLIIAILFAATANGTRAVMAQYIWILVMVLFFFRKVDFPKLVVIALTVVVALGAIKLIRYVLSDDQMTLEFYRGIGAYDSNHPWRSIGNLLLIQLNDNPWRTFMTFEYVPARYEFQGGRSTFFDFVTIAPGYQFNPNVGLSWYVMDGPLVEREFPPTLLAQGWFDFGAFGALLYSVLYPLLFLILWLRAAARPNLNRLMILAFYLFNVVIGFYGAPSWLFFLIFTTSFWFATILMRVRF